MLLVEGTHETVDAWLIRGEKSSTIMLTNFALPRHPIATELVRFTLKDARQVTAATIHRIDLVHANAKRLWEQMGKPEYPSPAMVAELKQASRLTEEMQPLDADSHVLEVTLLPQSVAAIRLSH
jgi:xylan 1,4-beta-xylosidase